jgi:hypothetical protein
MKIVSPTIVGLAVREPKAADTVTGYVQAPPSSLIVAVLMLVPRTSRVATMS